MESKKNLSKDIHKRYPLHFVVGLCISCGLVIVAFELNFKKKPEALPHPYDWDNTIAFVDPDFQIERPEIKVKRLATPRTVVRTPLPTTIEIAIDPVKESEPMIPPDPFEPVSQPVTGSAPRPVSDDPIVFAEVMPEPIDGYEKFYKHIARQLRYPRKAVTAEVEGKVFVEFVIDRNGLPTMVRVIRGIGYGCDEEAVKALLTTRWTPGRHRGHPVRVRMVMPIQFSLLR